MNSTSSSEYEYGPLAFSTAFPNILSNPFCPMARQPLIYFAKVEPHHLQSNIRNGRDNCNNFMKAFRWYTQEHGSGQRDVNTPCHMSNFAAWLDMKYGEYINTNCQGSNLKLKLSSSLEADKTPKKKKSRKKFGRMHSPWRKRRRSNSKEKVHMTSIDPNPSIQYILQPQNLSRTASERDQRTSRMQSTTTILSKESAKHTKIKIESKSLLSIYKAHGEPDGKVNKPNLNDKVDLCECVVKKDIGTQYDTYSLENVTLPFKGHQATPVYKNYLYLEETNKANDPVTKKISRTNASCQCNCYITNADTGCAQIITNINRDNIEHQLLRQSDSCMPKAAVMFIDNTNKDISGLRTLSAQTSDHSINLDQLLLKPYLFLQVLTLNK